MNSRIRQTNFFQAGGTLSPGIPSYVKRPADDTLFELTQAGKYCYVLTPRQLGKSSLTVRTAKRLEQAGVHTVIIDLTDISTTSAEQWYFDFITEIARTLRLSVDLGPWWTKMATSGLSLRFRHFFQDIVLQEISKQIVIFVDEVDTTLNLDFTDDFFVAIRAFYNRRAVESNFERLSFVLIGVASPVDLIKDDKRTSFNIGTGLKLMDFSRTDVVVFEEGLASVVVGYHTSIMDRIYHWTSGHPYLTQKVCQLIAEMPTDTLSHKSIDKLVDQEFLRKEASREYNLDFVRNRILKHQRHRDLLMLYRRVYQGQDIENLEQSVLHNELKLSGLVKEEDGYLRVRNEIYRAVFDQAWINENVSVDWNLLRTRLLIAIMSLVLVAGILGLIQLGFSIQRNIKKLAFQDGKRLAILSQQNLAADPVASLHLGLSALPGPKNIRPYVAESELAVTRALRTSQERAFLDFTDGQSQIALTNDQVAWSNGQIAIGGDGLHLVPPTLTEVLTLTEPTANTVRGVAWSKNENELLLSYDEQAITVWQGTSKIAERAFDDEIACAKWQPKGEQIAICSGQRLWLWTYTDDVLDRVSEFSRNVKDVSWSPNGHFVAAWDLGLTGLVWNVATGERLPIPEPEQPSQIWDVAWSPNSRHLVVTANDGTARLVNIEMPTNPQDIQIGLARKSTHAVFVDDGHFVTWVREDAVYLWTIDAEKSGTVVSFELDLGNDEVESVLFLAERRELLIFMTNGAAQRWDLAVEEPKRVTRISGHDGKILAADWAPSSQYLATSSVDGTARVWYMPTQSLVTTLHGHMGPTFDERADVLGVHWQDERHVVTYGADGSLRRWQVLDNRGEPLCSGVDVNGLPRCFDVNQTYYGHVGFIHAVRWLDDQTILTSGRDGAAGRLDLSAEEPAIHLLDLGSTAPVAPEVLWSPDGHQVFTYLRQSALSEDQNSAGLVRNFVTDTISTTIPGLIEEAFWLESGLLLSDAENNVWLVAPQSGETSRALDGYQSQILAAQQYSEFLLATGEETGIIRIWNLTTDEPPSLLNADAPLMEQLPVTGLQWNQEGTRLLSTGRVIMLWDMENGSRLWPVINTGHDKTYAAFSPDETLVATAIGTTIAILDVASGTVLWEDETSHDQPVLGVSWLVGRTWPYQQAAWSERLSFFADDGRLLLLTWSGDGTARIWDWQNDSEIMRMTDIGFDGIGAAAVSPDGTRIATTTGTFTAEGPQGIMRLWQTWHQSPETLLDLAQNRITRPLSTVQKELFVVD